jgi:hypothetical protein
MGNKKTAIVIGTGAGGAVAAQSGHGTKHQNLLILPFLML